MTDDAKTIKQVTARLRPPRYIVHMSTEDVDIRTVYDTLTQHSFEDAYGRLVRFHKLDAEKIARLYNEDACD